MAHDSPSVEDLLPHRDRMKLIDEILELSEERAVTRSVVADNWPLFDGRFVDAVVLIELVAQTAGINNSWVCIQRVGPEVIHSGWIVGVKRASLYRGEIPIGANLITRSENRFSFEGFREVAGIIEMDDVVVGEITLQIYRSDQPETNPGETHFNGRKA